MLVKCFPITFLTLVHAPLIQSATYLISDCIYFSITHRNRVSPWKGLFEQLICIISATFTYINRLWFISSWLSAKQHSRASYEAAGQKGPKEDTLSSWGEFFPSAKLSYKVLREVYSPSVYRCPATCELPKWTSLFSLQNADFGNHKQFQSTKMFLP